MDVWEILDERSNIADMFKLVGSGLLDLGASEVNGEFPLVRWKEACDEAVEMSGIE